jgi:hypothetical protein
MRLIGYLFLWVVIIIVILFLVGEKEVKLGHFLGTLILLVIGFVSLGFLFLKGYQKLAFIVLLIALAVLFVRWLLGFIG